MSFSRTFFLSLLLLLPAAVASAADFTGDWHTTYGVVRLTQEGNSVTGTYYSGGATLTGRISGNRLTFTYRETNATGEGWFELSSDGNSLAGKWRADGSDGWDDWTGTRASSAGPAAAVGFDGLFKTTYGSLRLDRNGNRVIGSYSYSSGSKIEGTVRGNKLTFTYTEPEARGEGWFELAADGNAFTGKWRAAGQTEWSDWSGERIAPEPGVKWLIVLEAPWEADLAEPPYSFGEMLTAYFKRMPEVRVRQRFIYDTADFTRATGELQYLAEPVVLLLSGHGDSEGFSLTDGTLSPERLGAAVAAAPNVFLLQLSSCSMMAGTLPDRVLATVPAGRELALSGYAEDVDWGGSAVLEFLYLDLVLGRDFAPAAAAEVVRQELNFAGDRATPGSPVGATRFRIKQR